MKIRSSVKGGRSSGGGWDANHNTRKLLIRSNVRSGRGGWDRNHDARKP